MSFRLAHAIICYHSRHRGVGEGDAKGAVLSVRRRPRPSAERLPLADLPLRAWFRRQTPSCSDVVWMLSREGLAYFRTMSETGDFMGTLDIHRATLETCGEASGTVVVIDVLRAFTTAGFAFDAGAEAITLVSEVREAYALREAHPDWLITGEVGGLPVQGFDFSNSPGGFVGEDLRGRRLVQRTSSGTQGVVRSTGAANRVAASLCCARATAVYLDRLQPDRVTMVITGSHPEGLGDEDQACADYLEGLIRERPVDLEGIRKRVRSAQAAQRFIDPEQRAFSLEDLEYALDVDRFGFAMVVRKEGAYDVMRAVDVCGGPRKVHG